MFRALVLCSLLLFSFPGYGGRHANKIHFLIAMDTHADNVGQGAVATHQLLLNVLSEIRKGREEKVDWTSLTGEDLTPKAVLDFYNSRGFASDTAVVFIYNGHGGLTAAGEHFLAMKYGNLDRESLRQSMERTGTVLQVILTDCCANVAGVRPPNRRIPAEWKVFEQLFLESEGMVDITGSQLGEFSWTSRAAGGFFSNALAINLCQKVNKLDMDGNGFVTWREFYDGLYNDTNKIFLLSQNSAAPDAEIQEYESQYPSYWSLNDTDRHLILKKDIEAKVSARLGELVMAMNEEVKIRNGFTPPRTRAYALRVASVYRQLSNLYNKAANSLDDAINATNDYRRYYQARKTGDANAVAASALDVKLKYVEQSVRCSGEARAWESTARRLP